MKKGGTETKKKKEVGVLGGRRPKRGKHQGESDQRKALRPWRGPKERSEGTRLAPEEALLDTKVPDHLI